MIFNARSSTLKTLWSWKAVSDFSKNKAQQQAGTFVYPI